MSFIEPIELPQPKVGPALLVGVASPLWGYFGAAALGGLTYWWMTRWSEVMNLEALYAAWAPAKAAEALPDVTSAAVEAAAEVTPPLGGESPPVSPLVAAVAEPPAPPAESVVAPPEPASFAEPAQPPKPRRAGAPPSSPAPDA